MKKFTILILLLSYYSLLFAQKEGVVVTGGDYFNNSNGSLTWTCGEIITEAFTNDEVSLTQGFNQSNLILSIDEKSENIDFKISAFPNPTNDFVTIKSEKNEKLNYQLFDLKGNLLKQDSKGKLNQEITVKELSTGIYFIKIYNENQKSKTIKIEKL